MARHDNREGVAAKRLTDRTRSAPHTQPRRDVSVRDGRSRRNGARDFVDAAVKRRYVIHVERDLREITCLAAEQRRDAIDCALDLRRWFRFERVGKTLAHPGPRGE